MSAGELAFFLTVMVNGILRKRIDSLTGIADLLQMGAELRHSHGCRDATVGVRCGGTGGSRLSLCSGVFWLEFCFCSLNLIRMLPGPINVRIKCGRELVEERSSANGSLAGIKTRRLVSDGRPASPTNTRQAFLQATPNLAKVIEMTRDTMP